MSTPSLPLAPVALIIGCGYVGRRLAAALIASGSLVYGTTRSATRAAALAPLGVRPLIIDVTQRLTFAALSPAIAAPLLDVYYLVPPGRLNGDPPARRTVTEGIGNTLHALGPGRVRRALLASSTAVYGQSDGLSVNSDTPPHPNDERGRLLLEGERLWLAAGEWAHVVRFAGLYGPDRIIGARALQDGAPLVGNPDAMLNLLHVDDAVSLLLAIMVSPTAGRIELGCDARPAPRQEYYAHLAGLLGVPAPQIVDEAQAAGAMGLNVERLRRASSKACDHSLTTRRTGWSPRFADFISGLSACGLARL